MIDHTAGSLGAPRVSSRRVVLTNEIKVVSVDFAQPPNEVLRACHGNVEPTVMQ